MTLLSVRYGLMISSVNKFAQMYELPAPLWLSQLNAVLLENHLHHKTDVKEQLFPPESAVAMLILRVGRR